MGFLAAGTAISAPELPKPKPAMTEEEAVEVARAYGRALTTDTYLRAPFMTGRITAVRGEPVDIATIPRNAKWAYDNAVTRAECTANPTP